MNLMDEVERQIWIAAAEYHEMFVLRCKEMADLDPMEAEVSALAIEVHTAMAEFARAEMAKVKP